MQAKRENWRHYLCAYITNEKKTISRKFLCWNYKYNNNWEKNCNVSLLRRTEFSGGEITFCLIGVQGLCSLSSNWLKIFICKDFSYLVDPTEKGNQVRFGPRSIVSSSFSAWWAPSQPANCTKHSHFLKILAAPPLTLSSSE